jgi:hypothetical protein
MGAAVVAHPRPRRTAAYIGFFTWSIATFFLAKSINVFSFWVPRNVMPYLGFVTPPNAFAEIAVHHLIQLTITIALIAVMVHSLKAGTWEEFGFTLTRWKSSLRDVGIFR